LLTAAAAGGSENEAIAQDMLVVLGLIARIHQYPPALGFEAEFKQIVRA
jgi:hypothetical protein